MIYTGPIDEFFDYRFGKLPYRSLEFRFETFDRPVPGRACHQLPERESVYAVHGVQVPHRAGAPEDERRLRISDRPKAIRITRCRARRTQRCTASTRRWPNGPPTCISVGRLGTYQYYNMDQVVAQALTLYSRLIASASAHRLRKPHEP